MYVSMGTILINPPALREAQAGRAYVFLMFYFFIFSVTSVRPIISTSAGPIFKKFAGLF